MVWILQTLKTALRGKGVIEDDILKGPLDHIICVCLSEGMGVGD